MARYIDADKFRQRLKVRQLTNKDNMTERHECGCIIEMLDNESTADVAPKGESLPLDVHEVLKQRAFEKAKAEVAREIFAELIDNATFIEYADGGKYLRYNSEFVAELKKKYT